MTSLSYDIQDKLKRLTAFEKIIIANVLIYVLGWFVALFLDIPRKESLTWLELPKDFMDFILQPWSIITYGFAHVGFWHLFFNMLVLYFVGQSFSNLFNVRLSLNVYFLGIIVGALAYLLVFNLFPNAVLKDAGALIGASAGVRAALIFLCAYMPKYNVRFITFNINLMYIGLVLVILDVVGLFSTNAGGSVAHLGGCLLGCIYALQLKKGHDIGTGFARVMDSFSVWFKPKRGNLKTVYRRSKEKTYGGHTKAEFKEFNNQKQIDIILDKIGKSGYESLSNEEKDFLFRAGKR
ncbi:MAG: rhomboid family intramembrane serine protease [Flavobacteriaceae bacterium]|nr:rhomboid family intramembrane serine protease [Flavobacteriaceae bacterium]